jgi:hypothetical protein
MAKNPNPSLLDQGQIIQRVFDADNDALRTDANVTIIGDITVDISAASGDNIALANADGSKFVDVETIGGKNALDVNVVTPIVASNPSVGLTGTTAPTSATELGAVDSNGDLQPLLVDPDGKLLVDITGTSVVTGTVSADIKGLTSFSTSQYQIDTTPVQVIIPAGTSVVNIKARTSNNANAVVIGNSNAVTNIIDGTGNGYPLFSGDTSQLDVTPSASIWAIGTNPGQIIFTIFAGN